MNHVDNYGKFYKLLKLLPGADKEKKKKKFTKRRKKNIRKKYEEVWEKV